MDWNEIAGIQKKSFLFAADQVMATLSWSLPSATQISLCYVKL